MHRPPFSIPSPACRHYHRNVSFPLMPSLAPADEFLTQHPGPLAEDSPSDSGLGTDEVAVTDALFAESIFVFLCDSIAMELADGNVACRHFEEVGHARACHFCTSCHCSSLSC